MTKRVISDILRRSCSFTSFEAHNLMLLPRLQPPLRAAIASIGRAGPSTLSQASLNEAFAQLSVCNTATKFGNVRHATHKAQGAVNSAKDGPGKRLGAKKSGGMSYLGKSLLALANTSQSLSINTLSNLSPTTRTVCHSWEHHLPPTRYPLVPRRELRHGS